MLKDTVYFYVFDTLADWEPGFALAELRTGRFFKKGVAPLKVKTFAISDAPVTTMGGLRILPDITIDAIDPAGAALLLLPGGETWMQPVHVPVLEKAKEFLAAGIPVAAICGATIALAGAGILDNRDHTSNDLGYLKSCFPEYKGENRYRNEHAVHSDNLITAGGTAPIEFAHRILEKLDVFAPEALDAWLNLYKTHKPEYYFQIMQHCGWQPS